MRVSAVGPWWPLCSRARPGTRISTWRTSGGDTLTGQRPGTAFFPGVVEGLERLLAADITLGLCSNKPQHLCDKVLGEIGLRPLFASVVGARDGVPLKPNPALLRLVTRELGVAAPDCVFVGDSELDHAIASATEMRCILVTYGYGDLDGVDPLVPRADTFDDVAGQVAAMLSRGASPWLSTVGTRA